jgi:hypothetical protein
MTSLSLLTPLDCCLASIQLFSIVPIFMIFLLDLKKKMFEDTKGVIRIRKSKKNRQRNGQNKKENRTNIDLQNITHFFFQIQ